MKPLSIALVPLALPLTLLLAPALSAQQRVHDLGTIDNGVSSLGFGHESVANMGDLDGDGIDDLACGAYSSTTNPVGDGTVFVLSGRTWREITRIDGQDHSGRFGQCVANLGDVDKDGVPDIGIGAIYAPRIANQSGPGVAFIYSGKTRKLIHRLQPIQSAVTGEFGKSMAGLGDVDGDGYADFAIGAPRENNRGYVYIYSGKTGTVLHKCAASVPVSEFGQSIVSLSDIDGDKIDDVGVLARRATVSSSQVPGPIWIFSGKTGFQIRRIDPTTYGLPDPEPLLRSIPDLDGDKKPDLVIAFPKFNPGNYYQGEVHAFSSTTGKLVSTCRAPRTSTNYGFGRGFDTLPDMDGDGSPEILIGDIQYATGLPSTGAILVFAAKTGKLQSTIVSGLSSQPSVSLGYIVSSLGDLNRDGNPDFYTRFTSSKTTEVGMCLLSARPVDMSSDRRSISIFKGGKAVLSIHAGPKHSKDLCMVIGSASGSYPGLMIGGKKLHLNLDSYLSFTLAAPHAVFFNNQSFLDAQGRGQVGFTMPLGLDPSLAGATLHHSCLLLGTGGLDFANIAIPLEITLF